MTPDAFQQVTLALSGRVYTYAAWMLRDFEEARDVTQEALLRLWVNRDEIDAESARAWLLRTAHRLAIDHLRRRGRRGRAGVGHVGNGLDHDGSRNGSPAWLDRVGAPGSGAPGEASLDEETRRRLASAVAGLPPSDRGILLLREAHGLSYDELADVLDRPLGTIKVMLHRARRRVREAMIVEETSR